MHDARFAEQGQLSDAPQDSLETPYVFGTDNSNRN